MREDYDRSPEDAFFAELHGELFGKNIFVITMLGAVAFCGASWWIMMT